MNSRERVKRTISFQNPDRAPISHAALPASQLKYGQALNEIMAEYREDFGWDFLTDLPPEEYPSLYKVGRNFDDFGTGWQGEWLGICGIPLEFPIPDIEHVADYRWPQVFSAGQPRHRQYSGHMEGFDERWYARGGWITYFEQMQQLVGMENLLMAIALDSPHLQRLMDDMLTFNLAWLDNWTALEYDGLHFADDWGEQHRLLINPRDWRRLFKPRYAQMFKKVKDAGMHVWYHSDGHTNDILPDLVEIGVDVINCQIAAVGHDWVARNLRGKVAFRTDIDRQRVMPFGSPSEVQEEVHKTFEACGGPQGGIIACGEIAPDVPLENIRAMYAAFKEYGTYR